MSRDGPMITLTFHLKTGPSEEIHTTSDLQTIVLLQIKTRDARASGDRAIVLGTDLQERPSKTVEVLHLQVLRLLPGNPKCHTDLLQPLARSQPRSGPAPSPHNPQKTHSGEKLSALTNKFFTTEYDLYYNFNIICNIIWNIRTFRRYIKIIT